ncbi:phage minor head protein [Epilithonimonas xixisoli]|uniref:Phage Mu protein F like protein n=1 Tax=Epilithonimonas xixisoli TaxID=1476462 RepID=A0A4V3H2R6_9FLAO|nr:phage minor head protein [Epilithonimonas xixisoli]TDX86191.1 phage Mu protein F like protein [Epilithonimonas xixisoli]
MNNPEVLINADLHLKTAETLINAISAGLVSIGSSDNDNKVLLEKLKQNIYHFSAAKSLTQMQYYRDAMVGDNGKILGTASFIKKIADTGEIFNRTHLATEADSAHMSAIAAYNWENIDSEYIEFSTVGDSRVSPEHRLLDKFTALKTDPIWKRLWAPLRWNCRCRNIPGKSTTQNNLTSDEAYNVVRAQIKDTIFENNVGITKVIFNDKHPYFINSDGKEVKMSWQHYGLPNLDKIKTYDDYSEKWMDAKGVITTVDFTADAKTIDKQRKGILIDR